MVVTINPFQQQQSKHQNEPSSSSMEINSLLNSEINVDHQMDNAIRISRQVINLLEDYRYLMSCYQQTCDCHVKFDHQIFSHKLEEKYNFLLHLSSCNVYLTSAFDNDNGDENVLNQLWSVVNGEKKNNNLNNNFNQRLTIPRIKIFKKPIVSKDTNVDYIDSTQEILEDREMADVTHRQKPNVDALKSEMLAFRCSQCHYIAFNQSEIMEHFTNHSIQMKAPKKHFSKSDIVYVCRHCSKEFSNQKWLDNHVKNVHANIKIYLCDHLGCKYKTKFRSVLEDHRKRHGGNKEFKCTCIHKSTGEHCESAFVTKRDMMAHVNLYHKNVKNYACTWKNCNATFKDRNRLQHHLYIHTGERPYSCTYCKSTFKQKPHLFKHLNTYLNNINND